MGKTHRVLKQCLRNWLETSDLDFISQPTLSFSQESSVFRPRVFCFQTKKHSLKICVASLHVLRGSSILTGAGPNSLLKTQDNPWSTRRGWDWVLLRIEQDSSGSWVSSCNLASKIRQRVRESLRTKRS